MSNLKRIVISGVILAAPFLMGASNERDAKPAKGQAQSAGEKVSADAADKKMVSSATRSPERPVYKPPLRGAPAGRIGGGTRGATERESFSLQVLVPDHMGLTVSDQPALYWFISKPTTYAVELTVIERNAVKPLVEKVVPGPERGGIQVVRLADYGVHLRRDVQYKWFVTLVTDTEQRSKDILAGGIIALTAPTSSLAARLKTPGNIGPAHIYAEEGLWYDALGAISAMIEASPNNADLRRQRASLLEQVGLGEAADFENKLLSSLQ